MRPARFSAALLFLAVWIAPLPALTFKFATLAPEGSPWVESLRRVAARWEELSAGQVRMKIYAGGVAGEEPDPDPSALENDPPWPSGRSNHFGVDLNRDWAWATQPETRARIDALRALPPQVYVDVHEMGSEQSYFFPPPAEPVHPRVPESARKWIGVFGKANAEAFDARGWSFFSREVFDLFYPAYGDSWPVFRGMVGMTYEVGGKGGLAHRRRDGVVVTLKERALKHWTALRATVLAAAGNRARLLGDYERFFRDAPGDGRRVFVFPGGQDRTRLAALASLLELQDVEVKVTTRPVPNVPAKGTTLPAGSLVVDTAQPQGRFAAVVTYNGAAFDLPLLRNHFAASVSSLARPSPSR